MIYLKNCLLLLVPIFIWNIVFYKKLPNAFQNELVWNSIPQYIKTIENISRIIVFVLPVFMILSLDTKLKKFGFTIYSVGLIIYFLSWIMLMYFPDVNWSKSIVGFMAPAYTTIFWFVGIALIGTNNFLTFQKLPVLYLICVSVFIVFHTFHAYLVFQKIN